MVIVGFWTPFQLVDWNQEANSAWAYWTFFNSTQALEYSSRAMKSGTAGTMHMTSIHQTFLKMFRNLSHFGNSAWISAWEGMSKCMHLYEHSRMTEKHIHNMPLVPRPGGADTHPVLVTVLHWVRLFGVGELVVMGVRIPLAM